MDDFVTGTNYGCAIEGTLLRAFYFSLEIASIGDTNGDGIVDFAISSSLYNDRRGIVYVIFGHDKQDIHSIDLDDINTNMKIFITHSGNNAGIGVSVSCAGDINGDGIDDFIIGSLFAGAYVIYGKIDLFVNLDLNFLSQANGFSVTGANDVNAGFSVVGNIDVNQDGISDVAVACPYDKVGNRVYVIYGTLNKYRSNINLPLLASDQGLVVVTSNIGDRSGYHITSVGDYNNDTFVDLLICAPSAVWKSDNIAIGAVFILLLMLLQAPLNLRHWLLIRCWHPHIAPPRHLEPSQPTSRLLFRLLFQLNFHL